MSEEKQEKEKVESGGGLDAMADFWSEVKTLKDSFIIFGKTSYVYFKVILTFGWTTIKLSYYLFKLFGRLSWHGFIWMAKFTDDSIKRDKQRKKQKKALKGFDTY